MKLLEKLSCKVGELRDIGGLGQICLVSKRQDPSGRQIDSEQVAWPTSAVLRCPGPNRMTSKSVHENDAAKVS